MEPVLCPIKAFCDYANVEVSGCPIFQKEADLLFPKSPKVLFNNEIFASKDSLIPTSGGIVTYHWHKTCERSKIPRKWWMEAHSGRNQVVNAAWADGQSDAQLLDITNWSSTRVLPEYISGPNAKAITVKLTKMTVEQMDRNCRHIIQ